MRKKVNINLFLGDIGIILLSSIIGGFTHDSFETNSWSLLITFLSWGLAWIIIAFWEKLYTKPIDGNYNRFWRPFWALIIISPLGGLIRGLILDRVILPIFVIVFGGICAVGLLIWRLLYFGLIERDSIERG